MSLALDGSGHNQSLGVTSLAISLSTANTNDIIIIFANASQNVTSVTSSHLNFVFGGKSGATGMFLYYAIATNTLALEIITVNIASSGSLDIDGFGISGGNVSNPFDGTPQGPVVGSSDPLSITTLSSTVMLCASYTFSSTPNPTAGAGWVQISGQNSMLTEYNIVSSAATYQALVGTGAGNAASGIVVAINSLPFVNVLVPGTSSVRFAKQIIGY